MFDKFGNVDKAFTKSVTIYCCLGIFLGCFFFFSLSLSNVTQKVIFATCYLIHDAFLKYGSSIKAAEIIEALGGGFIKFMK